MSVSQIRKQLQVITHHRSLRVVCTICQKIPFYSIMHVCFLSFLCSFLKTQFCGMHQGWASSVYFLVGRGGTQAAGLHFVLPVSDGPGPSALPAWRGGGCAVTLPRVFFLLLCPSRAILRWRTRPSSQPGGGEETHKGRLVYEHLISYRMLYNGLRWSCRDELIVYVRVKWLELLKSKPG